ncbi:MAG: Hsp20/alpha crystallin family protein [Nitrososphaerales archaeon]
MRSLTARDMFFEDFNREFDKIFRTNDLDLMFNVEHTKDSKKIYLDLPGVKKEDVTVTVDKNHIIVEAERKGYISGKYRKSFSLPNDLDTSRTELSLEDGVLTITIPVAEDAKPKTLYLK